MAESLTWKVKTIVSQCAVGARATAGCCQEPLWAYRHEEIDERLTQTQIRQPAGRLAAVRFSGAWSPLRGAAALMGRVANLEQELVRAGHVRTLAQCDALVQVHEALTSAQLDCALLDESSRAGNFALLHGRAGSVVVFRMTKDCGKWFGVTFPFEDAFLWGPHNQLIVGAEALSL